MVVVMKERSTPEQVEQVIAQLVGIGMDVHRSTGASRVVLGVVGSGKVGVLFRDDQRGQDFWANRNTIEKNRIIDSGDENGVAIDIQGQTKDAKIIGNEIRETRQPMNRTGIRISAAAQRSGWCSARCHAPAPPREKPRSTMRESSILKRRCTAAIDSKTSTSPAQ